MMEFRTVVPTPDLGFLIEPFEPMLFVGSCFADSIGRRFQDDQFHAVVNPYGVMYNPASVLHTVEKYYSTGIQDSPSTVFLTLGTNHVYRLRETGEIVDNCQKRPAALFQEEQLSVDDCTDYLRRIVDALRARRSDVRAVFTVSPIRYRKYGYHESQLSKATLLLAVDRLLHHYPSTVHYFPAYEIVLDELRDYRFYQDDMLHPSPQAVEYIYQRLADVCLSPAAKQFVREWQPLKAAFGHRPFNPDSDEYRQFLAQTRAKAKALWEKYGEVCDFSTVADGKWVEKE